MQVAQPGAELETRSITYALSFSVLSSLGMGPLSLLSLRSRLSRLVRCRYWVGRLPVRALKLASKDTRFLRLDRPTGRVPRSLL